MNYVLNLQRMTFDSEQEAWSTVSATQCSSVSNGCGWSTVSLTLCEN